MMSRETEKFSNSYLDKKKLPPWHKTDTSLSEDEDWEYYQSVRSCPVVVVADEDSIEIVGHHLYVHEAGMASKIKGKIEFTPWQFRQLLRAMVEDGDPISDWSALDLTGWMDQP